MGQAFDFNKIKKKTITVTLKDGQKLSVKMPQKQTFEKLAVMEQLAEDASSAEAFAALDGVLAEILSNNLMGLPISPAYVDEQFDFEEKIAFIQVYMNFVAEVQDDPN